MNFTKDINFNKNEEIEISDKMVQSSKKAKRKSFVASLKEIYLEYCSNTSIHGVQYFGQSRPIKEKIFWLLIFVVSIFCCSNLIENVYDKWNETPVIVSFSEKSTPVWSIPFPAVTVCSETKRVLEKEGNNFPKLFNELIENVKERKAFKPQNITNQEIEEFRTLLQVCNSQLLDKSFPIISTKSIDYLSVLDKMMPDFERYFSHCRWFSKYGDCEDLFVKTYTEEGICFTFNGLNGTDLYRPNTFQYQVFQKAPKSETLKINRTLQWSLENGYFAESSLQTYPARVLSAGARAGLFIALRSFKQEVDYACRGPVQGFKVLLHSPDDIPHVSRQFVRIPMNREVLIAVKPNMITTSNGISDYHPHRRQCFLNGERYLKFFKVYTQTNCELECLANYTYRKCGCVKFSMPRTLNMEVCNEEKIFCYDRAEDEMLMREFRAGISEPFLSYHEKSECNCLPACTSLVYNVEISQGNFDWEETVQAAGQTDYFDVFPGAQMSRLSIYFKENQFITSKRSELYGVTDFLANCGGIFGLFMGFSFLSVVEMLYHFTLRLWTNIKNQ